MIKQKNQKLLGLTNLKFLKTIYENDYIQLLSCLENEKIEENFIEYKEYSNLILNGIRSPNDDRDWFYDKYLVSNKNYFYQIF